MKPAFPAVVLVGACAVSLAVGATWVAVLAFLLLVLWISFRVAKAHGVWRGILDFVKRVLWDWWYMLCVWGTCCAGAAAGLWALNLVGTHGGATFCAGFTHPAAIAACVGLVMWGHIEADVVIARALSSCLENCKDSTK